jgi:hypothetical protein
MVAPILSTAQLHATAPSIFATSTWERVSRNCRFVPTAEVLGMMQDQGFYPGLRFRRGSRIPSNSQVRPRPS